MSVTKNTYLNVIIGILLILSVLLLLKPGITAGEESTSILGYVSLPQEYADINAMLEETYPGYSLNGSCWTVIILAIVLLLAFILLVAKFNRTLSLIPAMLYAVYGVILAIGNTLFKTSGVSALFIVLMLAILALSLFNGVWHNTSATWGKDPRAREKLKAITRAEAKKNIDTLALYGESTDIEVRVAAIDALGRTHSKEAFQPIVLQMSCDNPEIRIAAARALGELGDERGRSFLLHVIKTDPDERVISAMRSALSHIPITVA